MLQAIVGSQAKTEILRAFFVPQAKPRYVRELSRKTDLSAPVLLRELHHLQHLGLLTATINGNRIEYAANPSHPLYPVLRELVAVGDSYELRLQAAFAESHARFVFIFGSRAAGTARPDSDIDLFVIGTCDLLEAVTRIDPIAVSIGPEINPVCYTEEQFLQRKQQKNHFVLDVIAKPKIFLKGNPDEFARLAR
jgi:DNA-binding HxlR family transcriptional regulator